MSYKRYVIPAGLLAALAAYGQSNLSFKKVTLSSQFVGEGVSVGDFNKDGKPDVAAGVFLWYGPAFTERVKYGSGAETFNGATGYASYFMNQAAMDINGDGWAVPDAANPYGEWKFHAVGEGPDGFHYAMSTHGLGMGDINGDGRNDILAHDAWFEQPASIAGDPRWIRHDFKFHMDVTNRSGGAQMHADDVDGDGDADVVASLDGHGWGLAWFEQIKTAAGGITFAPHMIMGARNEEAKYGVAFSQLHSLGFADLDGDGRKDIVTGKRVWAHLTDRDPEPMGAGVLYAFLQTRGPAGTAFKPVLIDSGAGSGSRLEIVDVNGDLYPDVIVSSKKGANAFLSGNRPPVASLPVAKDVGRRPEAWRLSVRFPGGIPHDGNALAFSGAREGSLDVLGKSLRSAQAAGLHIFQPQFIIDQMEKK